MKKISVIGAGYVGLTSAACLSLSHEVVCYDIDSKRIADLNEGKVPFYEANLEDIIRSGLQKGSLSFTDQLPQADVTFICVGTPFNNHHCDLSQVFSAAEELSHQPGKLAVIKSTVPPGTNERVRQILNSNGYEYQTASNPEFLREGTAVNDFLNAERIVLGVRDEESLNTLLEIYRTYPSKKLPMNVASAELAKYACNCALAAKIAYINEISNLCEVVGADVRDIRTVMGTDSRIGFDFYKQGPGFGGSCFPKDVAALSAVARQYYEYTPLLHSILPSNNWQQKKLFEKLRKHVKKGRIAIWGAAFKPWTDDVRCSPCLPLIERLLDFDYSVRVHDPKATENLKKEFGDKIEYFSTNQYEMTKGCDALIIVTDWPEYWGPEIDRIEPEVIIDGRGCIEPSVVEDKIYEGFGCRS